MHMSVLLSPLKSTFSGYRIVCLLIFSFILDLSFHYLLAYTVTVGKLLLVFVSVKYSVAILVVDYLKLCTI